MSDSNFVVAEHDSCVRFVIAIDRRRLFNRQTKHHSGPNRILVNEQIVLVQEDRRAEGTLGFGLAPNPAGSEVLTRLTPPAHRNLVFSIKQAGVPLGGVLGGLAIPPLIEVMGWRLAAVVIAAVCIAATLLTWPFRSRIDLPHEQRMQYRLDSFRLTDILVPLRSLAHGNRLWRASWVGALLAIPQAAWVTFLVTYLVVVVGQ